MRRLVGALLAPALAPRGRLSGAVQLSGVM